VSPIVLDSHPRAESKQREEETNWCFHVFVAFIILLRDLPVKVAEDFAAMGKDQGSWGFSI
jgi:hypothetical protein